MKKLLKDYNFRYEYQYYDLILNFLEVHGIDGLPDSKQLFSKLDKWHKKDALRYLIYQTFGTKGTEFIIINDYLLPLI